MNHIVHIACSDAKGLVANITSILFKHGVNIEEMKEYVRQSSRGEGMREYVRQNSTEVRI